MVAISIIALVLSLTTYNNSKVLKRSKDASLMVELNHIRNAVHQFALANNGNFPASLAELAPGFLKQAPKNWHGSKGEGVYFLDRETGYIGLYDISGEIPSAIKDEKGKVYGQY
jgi:type II secretory pathway pseudopilin PulG